MGVLGKITRRTFLTAGFAGLLGLTAGVAWSASRSVEAFLVRLLRQAVPDAPVKPGEFERFARDYIAAHRSGQFVKLKLLAVLAAVFGVSGVNRLLAANSKYENFRRVAVTSFLIQSNYFRRSNPDEEVIYLGEIIACRNPFAQFD